MRNLVPLLFISLINAQFVIIPMDLQQSDHLKAYGIAFRAIERGVKVEWALNFRGGSFILPHSKTITDECTVHGVTVKPFASADYVTMRQTIEQANMELIQLEKAPKIAVYTPPNKQPWDDAVTLALTYAEVPYDKLYDKQIIDGELVKYDWLHLHHEDFTGQYGKFYASYRNAEWYRKQQADSEVFAKSLGFDKVSKLKLKVTQTIKEFVSNGGFLFAMCSATDALDIALAAHQTDILDTPFDGDPPAADYRSRLDFNNTMAFENFSLMTNPFIYEYSDIDTPPSHKPRLRDAESDYFKLFDFSAKYDPVPTMLTQNHINAIRGFMGQTTMFKKSRLKSNVVVLGQIEDTDEVKYIYGQSGKGFFAFYGGHDPEDYTHQVGDPPTDLSLHKNSPGYRLILNNVLFPAAKKKKLKT